MLIQFNDKVVIAFDEFQQIVQYPEVDSVSFLRTLMQSLPNLHIIYSGSDQDMLLHMFSNIDQPFYESGQVMRLHHIDNEAYIPFILDHFRAGKKSIDEAQILDILNWCHHRTLNVQILCNRLYATAEKIISDDQIQEMKHTILKEKEEVYYTLRNVIPISQWKVLLAFAQEEKIFEPYGQVFMAKYAYTNASTIRRAVKSAEKKGLLYLGSDKQQQWYELDDVFLMRWLQMIA